MRGFVVALSGALSAAAMAPGAPSRPSIELSHRIRHAEVTPPDAAVRHPMLANR
jgi:hypothetical protein